MNKEDCMYRAFQVAQRSTCARRRVGAVLAQEVAPNEYEILSEGWNHHVKSGVSCEAKFFEEFLTKEVVENHIALDMNEANSYIQKLQDDPLAAHLLESSLSPKLRELWEAFKVFTKTEDFKKAHWDFMGAEMHSEIHAILNAFKSGATTQVQNSVLFSSRSPCEDCAKATIEAGVRKVYYAETSLKGLSGGLALLEDVIEIEHIDFKSPFYT
jgi:dCMP deaminase